jgi:hypothetical protein
MTTTIRKKNKNQQSAFPGGMQDALMKQAGWEIRRKGDPSSRKIIASFWISSILPTLPRVSSPRFRVLGKVNT